MRRIAKVFEDFYPEFSKIPGVGISCKEGSQ